jgi:glycosyltransferase involved in cell wall biosynthesis
VADLQGSLTGEMEAHGFFNRFPRLAGAFGRLERWIVRQPNLLLTSSGGFARALKETFGAPSERIDLLPDFVDTGRFRPGYPVDDLVRRYGLRGKKVVAFLGVLTPYQGVDILLEEVVPGVIARSPEAHFLIMGYPHADRYEDKARAAGLSEHVTFTGRVPYADAPRHLCLAHAAVSPKSSASEANGKLLNYMAAGLPTVVFDMPVNREILGADGVYVRPGDAEGLANALAGLLADADGARSLGRRLRERAERQYGQEACGRSLVAHYSRLLGGAEAVAVS